MRVPFVALGLVSMAFAGCLAATTDDPLALGSADAAPYLGYKVPAPDLSMVLEQLDLTLPGVGVDLHARVVKPEGEGPFPIIVQFTPYTAPGQNVMVNTLAEPAAIALGSVFDEEFVRRGYAFAYADVRGTGDSTGCLDLRGPNDIADIAKLAEGLASQPWSNGKVGFIGASYPGSEAHMAAIAAKDAPSISAVVPVVASTSFYHYHYNDGVPYTNHGIGSTNTGYTQNAIAPTLNPQDPSYATRYAEEAECPYFDNMLVHGGLDQTGAYYEWWQERNLRAHPANITIPVLMAQGLADWNVKPDHIATWFNDLNSSSKTLIAGQWGHQYPEDAKEAYGAWWEYVTAFFDTYLKGVDTGMFQGSTAWVEDNEGDWHRSMDFPILEPDTLTLHLTAEGGLGAAPATSADELTFYGCPNKAQQRAGVAFLPANDATCGKPTMQALVFESEPFAADTYVSGVPLLDLVVDTNGRKLVHLVVVVELLDKNGEVVTARENYGYLNPTFRNGLMAPEDVPDGAFPVRIDMYTQEDVVKAGEKLRITLRHDDGGRTIEVFDEGETTLILGKDNVNALTLPLRPAALLGTRMG